MSRSVLPLLSLPGLTGITFAVTGSTSVLPLLSLPGLTGITFAVTGSTPQEVAESWLFATLRANAGLTALLAAGTAGIYSEIIPQAASLPAVVFFVNYASDLNTAGPARIQTTLEYVVKAVTKAEGYGVANAIDAQLDARLQAGSGAPSGGFVWGCMRIQPLRFMELDNGVQYRHAGGIYRLYAQTA